MVNRRTNLLTRRFSYFGAWESIWVGDSLIYSDLVYQDFKIISFLNGLFKKLSIPTGKFNMIRYLNNFIVIETDLYVIRPFWILYSHLDTHMESSFLYYFIRLFFNMPKLMLYADMHKYMNLHFFFNKKNIFFMRQYRRRVKYMQFFFNKKKFFLDHLLSFFNKYLYGSYNNKRICGSFYFFNNFCQKRSNSYLEFEFGFFESYDVYKTGIVFILDRKEGGSRRLVSYVIHDYDRFVVDRKLRDIERYNKREMEFLRSAFSRMMLMRNVDLSSNDLNIRLSSIKEIRFLNRRYARCLKSRLITLCDAEFGYFTYKFFIIPFLNNVYYLICFSFIRRFNRLVFLVNNMLSRSFSFLEVRCINSVIIRLFLLSLYKFFFFSSTFFLRLKNNRIFKKILKLVLIIHRFLLFIYKKIYGKNFKFSHSNLTRSVGFFIYKVRKSLSLFFKKYFYLVYSKKDINKILFSLCILSKFVSYVFCKRDRFFFFTYLYNFFPFFIISYLVKYSYFYIDFFHFCFYYEGFFNFYFFFLCLDLFSLSSVFVKFICLFTNKINVLVQFRFSFVLKNIIFLKFSYYYNYYYNLVCAFFFNYLFFTDLKLVGLFFNISKINFNYSQNIKIFRRSSFLKNELIRNFSFLLILLNRFLNVFLYDTKNNLFIRRVFINGYYKNFFCLKSFNFLFWFLFQLKLRMPSWNSFLKRYRFRYLTFSGRKFLFVHLNRIRTRFSHYVKRRIFTHLFFLNKSMYSFISFKLFSISFDRLVDNLEFVFSEYLKSTVLFLPNFYFERFKRSFWRYRNVYHFNQRKKKFVFPLFRKIRKKKRNSFFKFYSLYNNLLTFTLFFKYNKVLLLKMFFKLLKNKKLSRSRMVLFFIRYVKRIYKNFVRRKFFLKKKNLKRLCLILGRYRNLSNRFNLLLEEDNNSNFVEVEKLFTVRDLKKINYVTKFFKGLDFYSNRRRFFLLRYSRFRNFESFDDSFNYVRRWKGPRLTTSFPPIKDAKLLSDYIVYYLNLRVRLFRIFSNLRYWQNIEYRVTNTLRHTRWIENELVYKKYPLCGIRILCSGSFKKGGRKRRNYYHLWIRNQRLTRKMPLQTLEMDIDYFSSNTHVVTGTVGVKVWLCFSTISYRYKINDNVYYV